jgi:FkbM family methyltransferase
MSQQWRLKTAQTLSSLYRFNTLRIATHVFANTSGQVVSRRLYGRTLHLDVSRGNPQRLLYLEGERFIAEQEIVRGLIRPGLAAIDVGANIGYYALMLAHYLGSSVEIICIEPEPENLAELRRNIEVNRMANVTILAAGAAAEDGFAGLLTGINGRIVSENRGEARVKTLALNNFADRSIGFIKIDVEGYELDVLRGAMTLIERQRPNLFIEVHPRFQSDPVGVRRLLELVSTYYPDPVVYKKREESLFRKIAGRYFGLSGFKASRVDADLTAYPEIFWLACSADGFSGS